MEEPTNDLRPLSAILAPLLDRLRANAAGGADRAEAERLITALYRTADAAERRGRTERAE